MAIDNLQPFNHSMSKLNIPPTKEKLDNSIITNLLKKHDSSM